MPRGWGQGGTQGLTDRAGTASRVPWEGGRAVPLTARAWALCVSPGSPEPPCSGGCQGHTQQAVMLQWCPSQGHHRALVAELQAPWPHCSCPRTDSPFPDSPWHYKAAWATLTRKSLPLIINFLMALNSLWSPAALAFLLQNQNCCHPEEGGLRTLKVLEIQIN